MSTFKYFSIDEYPKKVLVSNSNENDIILEGSQMQYGVKVIETYIEKASSILPFESVVRLMKGMLYYTVNLSRIAQNNKTFTEQDLRFIKEFEESLILNVKDFYSDTEKLIASRTNFHNYKFKFEDNDIEIDSENLKVNNKLIEDASYIINSKECLIALICWSLWDFKKEINVIKLMEVIDSDKIKNHKDKVNNLKTIKANDLVFVTPSAEAIDSFINSCSIRNKSEIINNLFGEKVERIKLNE